MRRGDRRVVSVRGAEGSTEVASDLILVATSTPDHYAYPSSACLVQAALGAERAGAFDLSAACSGFVYALVVERYGGKVLIKDRVDGEPAKGTRVELWLPKSKMSHS